MYGRYNKCTRLYYGCLVYCGGADCVLFRYTILRKKGREWCYLNVSIITPFSRVNFKLRLKVSTFLLLGSHYVFCNTCLCLWYLHSYSMVSQFVGILRSSLSCITRPRPQTIHCTKSFCIPHLEWQITHLRFIVFGICNISLRCVIGTPLLHFNVFGMARKLLICAYR